MTAVIESLGLARQDVADLLALLRSRNETVATAESLTAGLVCAALTDVAGASAVVRGGLVVYATDLKAQLAGVDSDLLAEHGAVHPRVAQALAEGARRRCGADWGIGLTGVAGPEGQDGVSPGTVYLGYSGPRGGLTHSMATSGDRHAVRAAAVRHALEHFARFIR